MAIEFVDSFDHYRIGNSTSDALLFAELDAKWTSHSFTLSVGADGRTGRGLTIPWGSSIFKTLPHRAHWTTHVAFRINSGPGNAALYSIMNNGTELFSVHYNFDHTLALYAAGTLIQVTDDPIHQSKFTHICVDVAFSGTTNIAVTASLWVNSKLVMSAVSANTGINKASLLSGTATGNVHMLASGVASSGSTTFDDLVICNYEVDNIGGTVNRGFLGDAKVVRINPNGDVGGQTDFTPVGGFGGAHYDKINEIDADDDTTYLEDGILNDQDIWDWEDISLSFVGILLGLQYLLYAKKSDEGGKTMQHRQGPTGGEYAGPDVYLSDDYIYHHIPIDVNTVTGFRFSVSEFNAARFGVKVTT